MVRGEVIEVHTIAEFCTALEGLTSAREIEDVFLVVANLFNVIGGETMIEIIAECIAEASGPSTPPEDRCEDCFIQILNATQLTDLEELLSPGIDIRIGQEVIEVNSVAELCTALGGVTSQNEIAEAFQLIPGFTNIVDDRITLAVLELCIAQALDIDRGPIGPEPGIS